MRKELWVHLLAHNLLPTAMAQMTASSDRDPRELIVVGAVQAQAALAEVLGTPSGHESFVRVALAYRVGCRPDRFKTGARKRRLKHCPQLTAPKAEVRRRLARSD